MIPPFRFQHTELCAFAAASEEGLLEDVSRVLAYLDRERGAVLQDVAHTLALAWQNQRHRLLVVAESNEDLRRKLAAAKKKIGAKAARIQDRDGTYYRRAAEPPGKVAFLFPGEASAHPEMTRDLCLAHPFCREPYDDADQASRALREPFPLAAWIFPTPATPRAGGRLRGFPASILASHAANTLFARFFERLGIRADAAAGVSSGELAALELAGAPGYLPRVQRLNFLHDLAEVWTDIENREDLPRAGLHTPAFEPAAAPLRRLFGRWMLRPPELPLYSFATAAPFPANDIHALRETAARACASPVLFEQTLNRMHEDGFRVFIELGVRGDLTPLAAGVLKGRPHLAVAVNRVHRADIPQLHHALALLAAHGVDLQPAALHHGRDSRVLRFDAPAPLAAPGLPAPLCNALSNLAALPLPAGWFAEDKPEELPAQDAPGERGAPGGNALPGPPPLLQNATLQTDPATGSLTAAVTLSLDQLPFLRDESFGTTRVSAVNESLRGYTVLNLPAALEIMAEAAARLAPGKTLFQALNLRAFQWVGFDHNDIKLTVTATPAEYPDKRFAAFDVRLHPPSPVAAPLAAPPTLTATLLFTPAPPPPPEFHPKPLANPSPVNWSGTELYPDRLISGPLTRCVAHAGLLARDGLDYEVATPAPAPGFVAQPILVKALGDGLTLWQASEKFNGHIALPFRVQSISFHAPRIPAGLRLRAHLRITAVTPRSRTATLTLCDSCGRALIHATGWEALHCEVSPMVHRFVLRSSENYFTREFPRELLGGLPAPVSLSAATGYPPALFTANQGLWLRCLAFVLLSPPEREEWLGMRALPARRVEWLLGRAAAKEAARRLLLHHYHLHYNAPDIPIWASDTGKPAPYGPWQAAVPATMDLSIAHTPGLILAAAVAGARIGVDVENANRDLSETFTRNAFAPEEHELAAASGDGPCTLLRFWCAKEAFAKALGTGIRYAAGDLRIREYDAGTGDVSIEAVGQWAESIEGLHNARFPVRAVLWQTYVIAVCVL